MSKKLFPFILMWFWIASAAEAIGLDFVPNVGQAKDGSAFSTEIPGAHVAFRNTSLEYTFAVRSEPRRLVPARMNLVGANPRSEIAGTGLLPGIVNVHTDTATFSKIPTYGGLRYKSIYPGIDLELDGGSGSLKSTWVVAPQADPARIRWRYEGFDHVGVDREGNLVLTLPAEPGEEARVVTETAPVAWQNVEGRRVPVEVRYRERKDGALAFEVGAYDKDAPLVIDPTLIYNKKLFGLTMTGHAIAADEAGNVYLSGHTTLSTGYVAKLDAGAVPQWTTYFDKEVQDVALGPNNQVYLTRYGSPEGFLARLDNSTGHLIAPEVHIDHAFHRSIAVDAQGNSYVASADTLIKRNAAGAVVYTASFPAVLTAVALDDGNPVVAGWGDDGQQHVYVASLDAAGNIVHSRTFAGSDYTTVPTSIAVDEYGRVFVVGFTTFPEFPRVDPVDDEIDGNCGAVPCLEGFITQLSLDLGDLLFSTFFGGYGEDTVEDVAVGSDGTIFIAGWTATNADGNFPLVKPIAWLEGGGDAFVAKLTLDKIVGIYGIEYSTPLGDEDNDGGYGLALSGNTVYVTGNTGDGSTFTAFLAKLHNGLLPSGDAVNINFQPEKSEVPEGYLPDSGQPYQLHDNGWSYGWVPFDDEGGVPELVAHDLDQETDQQYDTYVSQANAAVKTVTSWEIALKPGRYNVRLVAGSPDDSGGPHWTQVYAEGVPILSDWRAEHRDNRWVEGIVNVRVDDGNLTLTMDSRTAPWQLAFLEISQSTVVNLPPQVEITAPLPDEVFNAGRPVTIHVQPDDPDGLIKDIQYFVTPAGGRRQPLGNNGPIQPYQKEWGGGAAGSYTIEAVATDNEGGVGRSSVTVKVQPLETRRDRFKVELRVFLPHETVALPAPRSLPWSFSSPRSIQGDDRRFSTTSQRYRVAQQVTVIPSQALDDDGIDETTIANLAGQSVIYDTGSSVNPEITRLTRKARSEGLAEVNKGVPYMVDFDQVEPDASVTARPRPDAFTSVTRFQAEVPVFGEPLCEIDWNIDVIIDANDPARPRARVRGWHEGMAYEINIDGQPVYRWEPTFLGPEIGAYCNQDQKPVDILIPLQ